jgi:hypothetical protein
MFSSLVSELQTGIDIPKFCQVNVWDMACSSFSYHFSISSHFIAVWFSIHFFTSCFEPVTQLTGSKDELFELLSQQSSQTCQTGFTPKV